MIIKEALIRAIIRKELIREATEREANSIIASEIPGGRFSEVDSEEPMSFFIFPNAYSKTPFRSRRTFEKSIKAGFKKAAKKYDYEYRSNSAQRAIINIVSAWRKMETYTDQMQSDPLIQPPHTLRSLKSKIIEFVSDTGSRLDPLVNTDSVRDILRQFVNRFGPGAFKSSPKKKKKADPVKQEKPQPEKKEEPKKMTSGDKGPPNERVRTVQQMLNKLSSKNPKVEEDGVWNGPKDPDDNTNEALSVVLKAYASKIKKMHSKVTDADLEKGATDWPSLAKKVGQKATLGGLIAFLKSLTSSGKKGKVAADKAAADKAAPDQGSADQGSADQGSADQQANISPF